MKIVGAFELKNRSENKEQRRIITSDKKIVNVDKKEDFESLLNQAVEDMKK